MAADYVSDDEGVVHLMMVFASNEDTFCTRDTSSEGEMDSFSGIPHIGPATCSNCREAFLLMKSGMVGAKWAAKLVKQELLG